MAFTPRLTRPEAGNKYYIRKADGGYSNAIKGNPTDKECNVLSNCVGYAYGRFNEIGDYGYCKYLAPVNAENFIQYKGSCEVGMTPKIGACMVWQKGNSLSGSDGAGHVAIVEKVISDTEVVTSESGWGSSVPFYTKTRKKGSDGRWGCGSAYKFLGFIYNPAVKNESPKQPEPQVVKPVTKVDVKEGDHVKIASDAIYTTGKVVPNWVKKRTWIVDSVRGDVIIVNKDSDPNSKTEINSPINVKYLTVVKNDAKPTNKDDGFKPYMVKVTASSLNVRSGPGTNYGVNTVIRDKGCYTIVAEANETWGKLKSGAGWISLNYAKKI